MLADTHDIAEQTAAWCAGCWPMRAKVLKGLEADAHDVAALCPMIENSAG